MLGKETKYIMCKLLGENGWQPLHWSVLLHFKMEGMKIDRLNASYQFKPNSWLVDPLGC